MKQIFIHLAAVFFFFNLSSFDCAKATTVSLPETQISSNSVAVPAGIVGWWPGDNNTVDLINSNNGVSINGLNYTNGEVRQAFNFSGPALQQCVDIPYAPDLITSNYSIETWVNPSGPVDSDIGQALIFGQSYGHVQLVVRSGVSGVVPVFQFGTDKYTFYEVDATNEIPIGIFTHLAGTWDGMTLRLYINGILNNAVTPGAVPADSGCDFFIGGFNHSASDSCNYVGQFFTGAIDEVSFYNRMLSTAEIQSIYNAGSAGKCPANLISTSIPAITSQPAGQTVLEGSSAVFSVAATGGSSLVYQWKFNGAIISGATNATLTLANLHPDQSGNYQVSVANPFGAVISADALLTVITQNLLVYNYSGSEKVTTAGQEFSYNYTGKMFFIPAATNGVFVGSATINKHRQYWVSPFSDYQTISIPGAGKHVYTVFGKAGSEMDSGGQPHIWSYLHTGLNTSLSIGARKTFSFPDMFSCNDTQVYPDPQSGNMILRNAVSTYNYASSATQTANNKGQTLADLVNALTTTLTQQGYQKQ